MCRVLSGWYKFNEAASLSVWSAAVREDSASGYGPCERAMKVRKNVAVQQFGWQAGSILILVASLFLTTFVPSVAAEKLTPENVAVLLPQLFRLHLSQHDMSPAFTKRMLKEYVTQLDPYNRFYLKSEADAIINRSDEELKKISENAMNGDFTLFHSILEDFLKTQIARDNELFANLDAKADDVRKEAERVEAGKKVTADDKKTDKPKLTDDEKKKLIDAADHENKNVDEKAVKNVVAEDDDEDTEKIKWTERPATQEERMSRLIKSASGFYRMNKTYLSEQESMKLALINVSEEHKKWAKVTLDTETPKIFLKAFMAALDPHTVYFDGDDEGFGVQLEPTFAGIGVKIRPCPMGAQIEDIIEEGPAEKSGLLDAQDQIIAVDGFSLAGLPISKIVQKIKGEKGSEVRLTVIKKKNKETAVVTLRRAEIQLAKERVKFKRMETPQGSIGVISVASFYREVTKEVKDRLMKAEQEKPLAGIVLDLRANQGGYLEEAVALAGLFIKTGPVVGERNAAGFVEWRSDRDSFFFAQPLVILTSQLSASASEIVAGALKDYGRAVVVGSTQTFGKGTVQRVIPLNSMNLPGEIKITTHQYFVAGGASTQLKGVDPDVVIPGSKLVDELLEKASDNPVAWNKINSNIDVTRKEVARWQNWKSSNLPMLQENSKKRLDKNQEYKDFFDVKKRKAQFEKERAEKKKLKDDEAPAPEKKKDEKDPQADEAALIAADMAATWSEDKAAANVTPNKVEDQVTK